MGKSVQFYGADQVLEAAQNRGCSRWGMFQQSQFLFKNEGDDLDESLAFLEKILENLTESEAIYTLKFYEDDIRIKEKTPCDGSFNFRLFTPQQREERAQHMMSGTGLMSQQMREMRQELEALKLEKEEQPEETTLHDIIIGALKDPNKLQSYITALSPFLSMLGIGNIPPQNENTMGQLSRIGTTGQTSPGYTPGHGHHGNDTSLTQSDVDRIAKAVETLVAIDTEFVEHIEKLAAIATKDKQKFLGLVSMIDLV